MPDSETRQGIARGTESERQRLLAQTARRAEEVEPHSLLADREARAGHIDGGVGIVGQRLDAQALRIDDFKHQFARIDDLTGDGVARRDDARDGRHERIAIAEPRTHRRRAGRETREFALGRFDLLARHRVGELLQPRHALLREHFGGLQLGELRHLVRAFDLPRRRHDIRQHLALLHGLPDSGQAARPGFEAAGDQRLHFSARVGVHHHFAGERHGAGQLPRFRDQRAHADLPLCRLGQEYAAVGQASRTVAADGRGAFVAVIVPVASECVPRCTCRNEAQHDQQDSRFHATPPAERLRAFPLRSAAQPTSPITRTPAPSHPA